MLMVTSKPQHRGTTKAITLLITKMALVKGSVLSIPPTIHQSSLLQSLQRSPIPYQGTITSYGQWSYKSRQPYYGPYSLSGLSLPPQYGDGTHANPTRTNQQTVYCKRVAKLIKTNTNEINKIQLVTILILDRCYTILVIITCAKSFRINKAIQILHSYQFTLQFHYHITIQLSSYIVINQLVTCNHYAINQGDTSNNH